MVHIYNYIFRTKQNEMLKRQHTMISFAKLSSELVCLAIFEVEPGQSFDVDVDLFLLIAEPRFGRALLRLVKGGFELLLLLGISVSSKFATGCSC